MNSIHQLLKALKYYDIPVSRMTEQHVYVINNYSIEVETSGVFKLMDGGTVITPFDDLDELCRFILS
jgi:hypothetical protein